MAPGAISSRRRRPRPAGLRWLAVAALAVSGCPPPPAGVELGAMAALVDSEEGRFPHRSHADLACTECHDPRAVRAGRPARPGTNDHAPCDRGQCHQAEFLAAPGPLCELCHERVSVDDADGSPLAAYPPTTGRRALASRFSHALHLDFDRIERAVGFHVTCSDCHRADSQGRPALPGHAACARCHAPEAATAPALDQCGSCHRPGAREPRRSRRFIVGDLRFRHGNHTEDRRGVRIGCAECHVDSAAAVETGDHPTPTTAPCVGCHDDIDRVPSVMRMRVCETCHARVSQRFGVIAPRSHLPARERPEDHTLAFRVDHAREAARDASRCARCHSAMSGSPRAVCDECHQVMQPRDHTATWREYGHGPAAGARADRCAVCHTTTFCVSCHARRPRSHFPARLFRDYGHIQAAKFDVRPCVVCHLPDEPLCRECHIRSALGGRR